MIATIVPSTLVRRLLIVGTVILLVVRRETFAQIPEAPSAAEILHSVQEGQTIHQETLDGQLRNDIDGKIFPFRMFCDGSLIRYRFEGTPATVVQMRSTERGSQLEVSVGGSIDKLTPANYATKILGTDLTYEELALRFIDWPDSAVIGTDTIKGQVAWKVLIKPPNHRTQFSSVVIWIEKTKRVPIQIEANDWTNKLISRFEVISAQELDGQWYIKQLRIESFNSSGAKAISRTYLEIKGIAK